MARPKAPKLKTNKKLTVVAWLRAYGMPPDAVSRGKHGLRYAHPLEKGVYWYYFSLKRRLEDYIKYGTCITCGKKVNSWRKADAGHGIAGSACITLQFHPKNVHLQHKSCNIPHWNPDGAYGYAVNVDQRYGIGTALELWNMRNQGRQGAKTHPIAEYRRLIEQTRSEVAVLLKEVEGK